MGNESALQRWCNQWISTGAIDKTDWINRLMSRNDYARWIGDALEVISQDAAVGPKFQQLSRGNQEKVLTAIAAGIVFGDLRYDYGAAAPMV